MNRTIAIILTAIFVLTQASTSFALRAKEPEGPADSRATGMAAMLGTTRANGDVRQEAAMRVVEVLRAALVEGTPYENVRLHSYTYAAAWIEDYLKNRGSAYGALRNTFKWFSDVIDATSVLHSNDNVDIEFIIEQARFAASQPAAASGTAQAMSEELVKEAEELVVSATEYLERFEKQVAGQKNVVQEVANSVLREKIDNLRKGTNDYRAGRGLTEHNVRYRMYEINLHLNAMIKDMVKDMNVGMLDADDVSLPIIRQWLNEMGFNGDKIQQINEEQAKLYRNDPDWLIVRWKGIDIGCDIIRGANEIAATRQSDEPEDSYKHRFQNVVREAV